MHNKHIKKVEVEDFWRLAPPKPSPGLWAWYRRIKNGWRPNKRISRLGYYCSAEFYRVYIWEYLCILRPLIKGRPCVRDEPGDSEARERLLAMLDSPCQLKCSYCDVGVPELCDHPEVYDFAIKVLECGHVVCESCADPCLVCALAEVKW